MAKTERNTMKVIEEIRAATQASEEDIKAMLQHHNGDVNAATMALLENPFQKVDSSSKKSKAVTPVNHQNSRQEGGHRDRDRPAGPRRDGPPPSGGRGGRGGQGGGRGSGQPRSQGPRSDSTHAAPKYDNGNHRAEPEAPPPTDTSTTAAFNGYDETTTVTTTPSSTAWGAESSAPAAKPAAAWGSGKKTMAEIIKSKQAPPPEPAPAPTPVHVAYAPPPEPEPEEALEEPEDVEASYEAVHEDVQIPEPVVAKPAPVYQSNWNNADAAKNLLNSLTKGAAAAAAAQAQVQQATAAPPAADAAPAPLEQTLSSADNTVSPMPGQYGAYGAAGAAPVSHQPPPPRVSTAAEIEAMQLSFGNFGMTEFGANFSTSAYSAPPDAAGLLLPKQPAQQMQQPPQQQAAEDAAAQAAVAAQQQQDALYKSTAATYSYNGYGQDTMQQAAAPAPAADAPRPALPPAYAGFGQSNNGFGGAFASSFPPQDPSAYEAAHQAFDNYGQAPDASKQYPNVAPGMAAYTMQQYAQQYAQQQAANQQAANPAAAAKPYNQGMYGQYGQQAAPGLPHQQQPLVSDAATSAASSQPASTAAALPGLGQMQFPATQAVVAGASSLNAAQQQYNPAALQYNPYAAPQQQYGNPAAPYLGGMGYGGYMGGYGGYQGVQYPPQSATGYAPGAAASTYQSLPQQQGGPRSQYSQYNNQAQALPQQSGVAGQSLAPNAYSNAGYGLTGYEDMSGLSAASAGGAAGGVYGMAKGAEKDLSNIYGAQGSGGGSYQAPHVRNNYGGGYPNQGYGQQGGYSQGGPKGYNNYNRQPQQYNQQYQGGH
ncbi:hypothetical protein CEUSTIGMA_g5714.t1 [Chlamydomonas eustigma]|uniref:GBF-interacting protein 1 N-terminal domain-containing protein n=1 Tax=Chlamydomonas eustigma TaxID=1157962 RepID=A0A250X5V3_9CHLO|nr:hypothetical protein CEUSTIGMA_g5714.t1 [Chlamydomonas eustigma]|eukprot:GAX78272.1 hypothetical protein CEUSTIGMA_g5714.t1 [Chlamydomonas eustigma]